MTKKQAGTLAEALRRQFEAEVDAEPLGNGRFRFALVSPKFKKMPHLRRQDKVWELVDRTLPREAIMDISLILAYAPSELAAS